MIILVPILLIQNDYEGFVIVERNRKKIEHD